MELISGNCLANHYLILHKDSRELSFHVQLVNLFIGKYPTYEKPSKMSSVCMETFLTSIGLILFIKR